MDSNVAVATNTFEETFLLRVHALFRDLLIDFAARPDNDFLMLCGALREHEITVFTKELPREDRNICIDFNNEDSRRQARNELRKGPAPSHRRIDFPLEKRTVMIDLDATSAVLAHKWIANLLPIGHSAPASEFHVDRNRIIRDKNGMSRLEAESWLLALDAGTFRNCIFNMLRPHVTAYSIARKLRWTFYTRSIESTDAWKEFEHNLAAIIERSHQRVDEAIARVQSRYAS